MQGPGRQPRISPSRSRLLSIVSTDRLQHILREVLDEHGFLSPHGLRALSLVHRDEPFGIEIGGVESVGTTNLENRPRTSSAATRIGGARSGSRSTTWSSSRSCTGTWFGADFRIEYPTGSGERHRLRDVARALARRLVSIWLPAADGRLPVHGAYGKFSDDPEWRDLLPFYEYFHGDTGAGLGASHQTGWTGLVAHLLCQNGIIDAIESGRSTRTAGPQADAYRGEGEEGRIDGSGAPCRASSSR